MKRGVDSGGSPRHWRQRGEWVMALEEARVCTLDLEKWFRLYRV